MQCRAFRFGRLSSSQFQERMTALNEFLQSNTIVGSPITSASDEEGTVMFVFYTEEQPNKPQQTKDKK
jgi:hypothetical protein